MTCTHGPSNGRLDRNGHDGRLTQQEDGGEVADESEAAVLSSCEIRHKQAYDILRLIIYCPWPYAAENGMSANSGLGMWFKEKGVSA
jgi:hypothetical protein